ncbi:hypothetical protein QBC46DRAFT_83060 [Diplogelasinospora grovesii]|uniref:F-box domain-containing protein n=1 Tax=Diplogelasinospora grovesii TaxID=303347 RepID=A0AAN6RZA2_9PEZI|nr:hypothetical protein QBC46DRAFT_83060 [Diplogelasinospora grovesii]
MGDQRLAVDQMGAAGRGARTFESLPPEILTSIIEYLVPNPPEIGETRPVDYERLSPGEPWFDFTRCRRGLRSMCRVSRRFRSMAQPLLYKVMAILEEESMILFFRTLYENPQYRHWPRYLSVHLTLTQEFVIRETRKCIARLLRTFKPRDEVEPSWIMSFIDEMLAFAATALGDPSHSAVDLDDMPQVIITFILWLVPRIETLLLQVPICDDDPDYTSLCLKMMELQAFTTRREAEEQSITSHPSFPLRRIETLCLQGDPELLMHFENEDCSCDVAEVWGVQVHPYAPLINCLPNLVTMEISGDDGMRVDHLDEDLMPITTPQPYLRRLRHIYLHDSVACPRDLSLILKNAPHLLTLYMSPRRTHNFWREYPEVDPDVDPDALDVALSKHGKHLRHLDVAWLDAAYFASRIGPAGRLASLPELRRLERLCIQLAVLYGDEAAAASMTPPLADLLPPSLLELAVEDWWWHYNDVYNTIEEWGPAKKLEHYHAQRNYRTFAVRMLLQFASNFRERLPRLRRVMLLCKIPWTWMVEGDNVPMDFHFTDVKEEFKRNGVEFVVEEM